MTKAPTHPLRIGVLGAPSTGKTLLVRRIDRELRRRDISVEHTAHLGRRATRVPLPQRQDLSADATRWAIATGIADEVEAAARPGHDGPRVVLADQVGWEALACFRAAQEWHSRAAPPRTDREALHRLASAHAPYDLLFATHLDPGLRVRREHGYDSRYRILVDRHIHRLLREEGLAYVPVTSDRASQEQAVMRAVQTCHSQAPL
ncbi:AAA family ATPase [Streptomyces sp. NPDC045470]|uniref:AAA family ATPase n=1 Tax=Streptomyces sp. NPDC045470 TaxID=3155469 RepID=UPI0033C85297